MNYHNIKTCDLLNGEGARVVLWVSGCQHSCEGCFNKQTWDKNSGIPFTDDTFKEIGIDHDAKEASNFKNSFYKALDSFKEKKGV